MKYYKRIASLTLLLFALTIIFNYQLSSSNKDTRNIGEVLGVTEIVGAPYLIWDGETFFKSEHGTSTSVGCYEGSGCFEGNPTPWYLPAIKLDGLSSYTKSIANYDAIRFYARSSLAGKTFNVSLTGLYPSKSNSININPYIEGGQLDTTWRLVTVPTSVLDNGKGVLDRIYSFSFGTSTTDHKIYIDLLEAVSLSSPMQPVVSQISPVEINGNINAVTTRQFNITNTGNAALVINNFTLSGANASEFGTSSGYMIIDPGQTKNASISFKPATTGTKTAVLTINHNKTSAGYSTAVSLTGQATEAGLNASPSSLDFGSVPTGQNSVKIITVSNTGSQSLSVSSLSSSNSAFTASPASLTIPANSSQNISVTFAPASVTKYSGALTINSNDPLRAQMTVSLSGNGAVSGEVGDLSLRSTSFSSSKVSLAWSPYAGADKTRIYIGSEPSDTPGADLPIKKLIATLSGTATSYTINNLAASTNVFIRVEALSGETLLATNNIHIKTTGGPKTALDTGMPLREAHLVAPNIIELVLANNYVNSYADAANQYDYKIISGYNGPEWQNGAWTITRNNGNTASVTNVYRHSVSAGQPYYSVGWPVLVSENYRVDVDHHIYLKLDQTVGNRDVLTITGPKGLSIILPYSDKYLETPSIQVNQVGYSPQATRRYAYVSNWLGDGGGLNLSSFPATAEVLVDYTDPMTPRTSKISNLQINLRKTNDPDSGGDVKEIDLSSRELISEGTVYRVRIPGVGVSWPTQVSNSAIFKAFYTNIRGVYFNRYGRNLQPEWTDYWSTRPADHATVYTSDYPSNNRADQRIPTQPLINSRPVTGGSHDAGDFDQQVDHFKYGLLLMDIYEYNPKIFTDNQLNILESDNGIPDLLDEALYAIKGWEQLQDYGDPTQGITNFEPAAIAKNDGAVRGGVESYRHPAGYYFADADQDPYWTYAKDAKWSLAFAGNFAKASRLVAPFNPTKANELKQRAIAAYNYSTSHGTTESIGGLMFYAAGELYRLTGDPAYKNKFDATWKLFDAWGKGIGVYQYAVGGWANNKPSYPNATYLLVGYMGGSSVNPTYISQLTTGFTTVANQVTAVVDNDSAHRRSKPAGISNAWGYGTASGVHLLSTFDRLKLDQLGISSLSATERQKYINAISLSTDYLLGANPAGVSWITGLGSKRVEEPLHTDSLAFMKQGKEPVPGLHVFGPTGSMSGETYYLPSKYVTYPQFMEQPIMRRWGESRQWPGFAEVTTDLTITDVLLFAALLPTNEVLTPPDQMKPLSSDHRNPLAPRYSVNTRAPIDIITPPPPVCIENWTCTAWSTCTNSNQSRTCSDSNSCGTIINKPTLSQGCTPNCSPNWTCSSWTTCTNLNKSRTCTDANSCGITVGKPAIVSACTADSGGAGGGQVIDLLASSTALTNDGGSSLPSTAIRPAATEGIIAKIANSPAVYYISNAFRYLFVNRLTYSTWSKDVGDLKNNFSTLKLISQSDFEKAAFGSNIPAKPGSLIKFDNSPKAYGVGPEAKLYEIADLAAQKALYGLWTPYIIQTGFRDSYFDHGNAVGILTATSTKPQ